MIFSKLRPWIGKKILWNLIVVYIFLLTFVWIMKGKEKPKNLVLILSYSRSGASMVTELLKFHSSSFFLDDPLKPMTERFHDNRPIPMVDGTTKQLTSEDELRLFSAYLLRQWLNCDLGQVDSSSITSESLLDRTTLTRNLDICSQSIQDVAAYVKICLHQLQQYCSSSETRVINSASIDMETAGILLGIHQDIKILYFIRDPRAIFYSLSKVGLVTNEKAESFMSNLCTRMLKDVYAAKNIQKNYPKSFKVVVYEEFSEHFIQQSRSLLAFLNLEMEDETRQHLQDISMKGNDVKCQWCSVKGSSSQTARAWRKDIPWQTVLVIDNVCKTLYKEMGYTPVYQEKHLRRLSFPLHKTTFLTSRVLQ